MPDNLFPTIGAVAEQVDSSQDLGKGGDTAGASGNDDEERLVQEIESLCVKCEEQVTKYLPLCYILTWENKVVVGNYATALDVDPLFPRGHCGVLPL